MTGQPSEVLPGLFVVEQHLLDLLVQGLAGGLFSKSAKEEVQVIADYLCLQRCVCCCPCNAARNVPGCDCSRRWAACGQASPGSSIICARLARDDGSRRYFVALLIC